MAQKRFWDDFGQYDTKIIILRPFFCQTPLRNSVVMATPKVPGDQKLFERVSHLLKLKVTKFQLPTPNGFRAIFNKPAGGGGGGRFAPIQNRIGSEISFTETIIHKIIQLQ